MFDHKNLPNYDDRYLDLLGDILDNGALKGDRTGTGTRSVFGRLERYDLTDGRIPLLTTKQIFYRSFIHEMLWFLSGSTDVDYLKANGVSIWDSWIIPGTEKYQVLSLDERWELYIKDVEKTQRDTNEQVTAGGEFHSNQLHPAVMSLPRTAFDEMSVAAKVEFLTKFNIPTQKLVGGSIGPGAYGAVWRNIEDTRIIEPWENEDYRKKGFVALRDEQMDDAKVMVNGRQKKVMTRQIDQLANAIHLLKTNPDSRRIIVHLFDNRMIDFCALPPCHSFHQFWSRELTIVERTRLAEKDGQLVSYFNDFTDDDQRHAFFDKLDIPKRALSCLLYARSQDFPVGTPFNVGEYALLTHLVAHVTNMVTEEFVWVGGDVHAYRSQFELAEEQLNRSAYKQTSRVVLNPKVTAIDQFTFDDIEIIGYEQFHPAIKYPVEV